MNILYMDALALSSAIETKDVSTFEVMQATLTRIEQVNGDVNAIVSMRDEGDLLEEAKAVDAGPRKGWLHGIPIAIKDLANAAGLPTSKGSPIFAGQVAVKDDVMVARLRAAGALIISKTNTPEFGLGSHTYNPVHGATRNPYDLTKSAGGSSGGAAAALATGMLCVADGSDMMGSLRNPAGWNNVYGMRPTWGSVPSEPEGDMFRHQLSTSGPMARSPADLAALLDTMTGVDPRQPHGFGPTDTLPYLGKNLPSQRIGWLGDWDGAYPYADGITEISQAALLEMGTLGHKIEWISPRFDADALWDSWTTLRSFAIAADFAAYYDDPAKRGFLKPAAVWEIERGMAMDAMAVHRASLIRSDWFRRTTQLFQQVDVLALPSAQLWPFDVEFIHPTEIAGVQMDTYHRWMQVVIPAGLIGLPVVNIPIGFGADGLPAGLQLIGPRGSDARLLQLAQHWHAATEWPQEHPPKILT